MSWKENGNGGDKDPWRGGGKSNGPPDLDELLRKLKAKLFKGGGGRQQSAGGAVLSFFFIFIVLSILWVLSGIFIVSPAEEGVVLRFGKYVRTVKPGPHWVPRFIESPYLVNVQQVDSYLYSSEMLTVDENIVSVQLSVQYRRTNPKDFLFNVVSPIASLEQATASALRQVVGNTTLDNILTKGRAKVRQQTSEQLTEILAQYETGLEVVDVNLQPAKPPQQVTAAFDDAIKAREDEQRYINIADAYSNKVQAIVQGKVQQLLQSAEADRQKIISAAKADTAGYLALLPQYKRAPNVTRERMYLETVESIMEHSSKVLMDVKSGNNMVYLPLDRMLEKYSPASTSKSSSESEPTASSSISMSDSTSRPGYSDFRETGGYRWQH